MLSRSSKILLSSALGSPDSVQPLHDYISNLPSAVDFPSIQDELTDANDEDDPTLNEGNQDQREEDTLELDFLIPQNDFRELFNRFFVLRHQELSIIQANIRRERGLKNKPSILSLQNINNMQVEALRNQYYQLQMLLFNMSKGKNHSSTL